MATTAESAAKKAPEQAILNLGLTDEEKMVGESLMTLALRRLRRDYLTLFAASILIALIILALLAPVISGMMDVSYRRVNLDITFEKIGAQGHILGTDDVGRDHLSRLLYGARVSLGIAVSGAVLSLAIGSTLGVIAGFYQGGSFGFVDDLLMWGIITLNSIPGFFLLLIISAMLNPTVFSLILILAFLSWTGTMRFVRGETLSQRSREYIVAAQAIGANPLRIMYLHIMPNIFSVIIINLASDIGGLILVESALSYLNLGVRPPTPSWGNMLTNAQTFFTKGVHLVIFPGMLIVITVLCLFLIGDGLRDAFDPQASKKVA
jgi:peptide/nickel transport system permease protein